MAHSVHACTTTYNDCCLYVIAEPLKPLHQASATKCLSTSPDNIFIPATRKHHNRTHSNISLFTVTLRRWSVSSWIEGWSQWPTGYLQCSDNLGWVIWLQKLSPTQSIKSRVGSHSLDQAQRPQHLDSPQTDLTLKPLLPQLMRSSPVVQ